MAPLVTQVFPYLLRAHHKKQKKELLNLLSFYFMDPVVGSGIYGWIFPRLQQLPAGGSCPFEWSPAGPAASSSKCLKAGERRSRERLLPWPVLPPSGAFPLHPCSTQFLGMSGEVGAAPELLSVPQNPRAEQGWGFGSCLERCECSKRAGRR